MKILFLGSSRFSKFVLQRMHEKGLNIVKVITSPDKESGRGHKMQPNEVKLCAQSLGIDVFCSSKLKNDMQEIKNIDFDISVVASFGQILPNDFLDLKLCLNVHPSKLPMYRGASPIQNAILNGDKQTAVTIIKVGEKVDSGDIALQKEVEIYPNEMYNDLEERLAILGGDMIFKAINLQEENKLLFKKQDDSKATYVKKFVKEDGLIDFSKLPQQIENQVRALSENLGTYFFLKNNKIKVFSVKICDKNIENLKISQVLDDKKHFIIGCNQGAVEILACLSPSGKKMSGADFLNGFHPQGEFVNGLC